MPWLLSAIDTLRTNGATQNTVIDDTVTEETEHGEKVTTRAVPSKTVTTAIPQKVQTTVEPSKLTTRVSPDESTTESYEGSEEKDGITASTTTATTMEDSGAAITFRLKIRNINQGAPAGPLCSP